MAPLIASLLASGLGTIAQAVINKGQAYVEEKTGIKIDELIQTDEGKFKLAQLQLDKEEMFLEMALENRKVDMDFYKTEVADRSSAREANTIIATSEKAGWLNQNLVPILAIGTISASLYGLIGSQADSDIKYALAAILGQVLAYYFGSSSIAWKQQNTIGKIAKGEVQ